MEKKEIKNMRRLLVGTLALTLTFPPLPAQKIDTETASREHVVRVQTAMNHLTVIEVAEPVTTVAVGSPQAFKVERRENKVFIQPLQENVATNLFIWTASTRLNYELVPAVSDAGQMDFAIDYHQPPQQQAKAMQPKPPEPATVVPTVPSEMLLNGTPVRLVGGAAASKANLGVLIRDVYRKQDEVFVRFSIENRSAQALRTGTPAVVSLTGLKFDRSLWSFQNAQLGMDYACRLKTYDAPIPVKIRQCEPGVAEVGPGEARIGLIELQLPPVNPDAKKTQPTVLQILFPIDRTGNLTATLVL
jgi:Conjugal transfer protein